MAESQTSELLVLIFERIRILLRIRVLYHHRLGVRFLRVEHGFVKKSAPKIGFETAANTNGTSVKVVPLKQTDLKTLPQLVIPLP